MLLLDCYVFVAVPYNFCAIGLDILAICLCNTVLCTVLEHAMTEMRFK